MADNLVISLIIKAIDRATGPLRKVTNNFAHMRKGWERAQKSFAQAAQMRQAAEGVSSFARKARAAIAAPINTFEDFQAAMSGVKAVTRGLSEQEFTQLTEKAKELGATTRYTGAQAAEAMKFFGMAGFSAAQQMEAVPAALDLATAGGTDLARTADILSDIMGAFNKTTAETVAVSDALAVAMTGSNVTLETLFETMKLVGPIATDMGFALSDVAAMTGIMGSAGIKGSMAGTALRGAILRLVDPSDRARRMLKKMGVEVVDVEGNMRPLTEIIAKVAIATEDMGTATRGVALKEIFGMRAVSAISKLLTKVKGGEISKFAAEIENSTGAAAEMARIMDDNARGATIRLTSAIDGLSTSVGEGLEPTLTSIKETLMEVAQWMTGWTKAHPTLTKVMSLSVGTVALLATGIGGLMFVMVAATTALGVMSIAAGSNATGVQVLGAGIKWLIFQLKWLPFTIRFSVIPALKTMAIMIWTTVVGAIKTMAFVIWATVIPTIKAWAIALFTRVIPGLAILIVKLVAVAAGAMVTALPFLVMAAAIGLVVIAVIRLKNAWKDLDFGKGVEGIMDAIDEGGFWGTLGELFDPRTVLRDIGVMAPTGGGPSAVTMGTVLGTETQAEVLADVAVKEARAVEVAELNDSFDSVKIEAKELARTIKELNAGFQSTAPIGTNLGMAGATQ